MARELAEATADDVDATMRLFSSLSMLPPYLTDAVLGLSFILDVVDDEEEEELVEVRFVLVLVLLLLLLPIREVILVTPFVLIDCDLFDALDALFVSFDFLIELLNTSS